MQSQVVSTEVDSVHIVVGSKQEEVGTPTGGCSV